MAEFEWIIIDTVTIVGAYFVMSYIAGIVVVICAYLVCLPSIIRYFIWKTRYSLYKRFPQYKWLSCDRKVLVSWIQLWYIKSDEQLQIPWISGCLPEIWLSHGPTMKQSMDLIEHFEEKPKPTLFIGQLEGYTNESDMEGLEMLKMEEFKLKIWKEESNKVDNEYAIYLENYIEQLGDNDEEMDIIKIACAELDTTLIKTDEGNIYRNSHNLHAENVLIQNTEPQEVQEIWIDNSPCTQCSNKLVEHFMQEIIKPVIYVGKLFAKDPDGMWPLVANRFTVRPWREYIKYTGRVVRNTDIFNKIEELERINCQKK